jgi:uncharacterized integral membrane protein
MNEIPDQHAEGDLNQPVQPQEDFSLGFAWGALLLFLGAGLVAVFAVQNTDPIAVRFLWMSGDFPLSVVILVTVAAAVLIAQSAGVIYRRRRRVRRAEKEELKRLRNN